MIVVTFATTEEDAVRKTTESQWNSNKNEHMQWG